MSSFRGRSFQGIPEVIPRLVTHEGIGFLLVQSETHGAMALGKQGVHYLERDTVEGEDPLASFGPRAAEHLRCASRFTNAPDMYVNSAYNPETGEVLGFESYVGTYGGLGGPQSHPFLLYPSTFDPGPEPIVGAAHLHTILRAGSIQFTGQPTKTYLSSIGTAIPGTTPRRYGRWPSCRPGRGRVGIQQVGGRWRRAYHHGSPERAEERERHREWARNGSADPHSAERYPRATGAALGAFLAWQAWGVSQDWGPNLSCIQANSPAVS